MKIAVIIVRTLFGLLFMASSIVVLFNLARQPELKGSAKLFMDGMAASVYFIPLLKITELVCGIAFVIGRFVPLATVVIFPVTVNIAFYHAFLDRQGLPVAIVILLLNLFLAYAHRKNYSTLLAMK